jgi:GGDEF domain-containing protein
LGGDEFAWCAPGGADDGVHRRPHRGDGRRAHGHRGGDEVRVGISVGIAHSTEPLQESDVEAADRALYERKRVTDR